MIKITNKEKDKIKSILSDNIFYGSCFLGRIKKGNRQLYFHSRIGIVSLEDSQVYYGADYRGLLVEDFEYVDIEVTMKPYTTAI